VTTLVAVSPDPADHADRAPLELGALAAHAFGSDLVVASVVPAGWGTPTFAGADREHAAYRSELAAAAERSIVGTMAEIDDTVHFSTRIVAGRSVSATLLETAEQVGARRLVIGSGSDGAWGRIVLSSTADRLLHSSHIPVAIAPRGYRRPECGVPRVTVAFRGDEPSEGALSRAATIAGDLGVPMRVATLGVLGRTVFQAGTGGEDLVLQAFVERSAAAQDAVIARLRESGHPAELQSAVSTGRDWDQAIAGLDWLPGEVLVVGSSSTNPVARVFLGSNSAKIVRHSPVPVVVVPQGRG
jgi:nucleotide-binding universal stress UspA family protein